MTSATDAQAADDASRRLIREALDETLFVEASAGTGKTSALVDRYVALVLAGKPVEKIVAPQTGRHTDGKHRPVGGRSHRGNV